MEFILRRRVFCAALSILISGILILSKIPALELKADSTPAVGDLVIQGGGGGGGGALAGGGGGGGYVEYKIGTVTSAFFGAGGNGFSASVSGGGGSISGGAGSSEDKRPLANSGFGGNSGDIEGGTRPLSTPSSADIGKGQGLPPAIPHATDRMGVVLASPTSITQTGNLPIATVNTTSGGHSSNTNGGAGGNATVDATENVTLNNLTVIGGQNGSATGANPGGTGGTATFNAAGRKLDAKTITLGYNYAVRNPVTGAGEVKFTVGTLVVGNNYKFTIIGTPDIDVIDGFEFDLTGVTDGDTLLDVTDNPFPNDMLPDVDSILFTGLNNLNDNDTITLISNISGIISDIHVCYGGKAIDISKVGDDLVGVISTECDLTCSNECPTNTDCNDILCDDLCPDDHDCSCTYSCISTCLNKSTTCTPPKDGEDCKKDSDNANWTCNCACGCLTPCDKTCPAVTACIPTCGTPCPKNHGCSCTYSCASTCPNKSTTCTPPTDFIDCKSETVNANWSCNCSCGCLTPCDNTCPAVSDCSLACGTPCPKNHSCACVLTCSNICTSNTNCITSCGNLCTGSHACSCDLTACNTTCPAVTACTPVCGTPCPKNHSCACVLICSNICTSNTNCNTSCGNLCTGSHACSCDLTACNKTCPAVTACTPVCGTPCPKNHGCACNLTACNKTCPNVTACIPVCGTPCPGHACNCDLNCYNNCPNQQDCIPTCVDECTCGDCNVCSCTTCFNTCGNASCNYAYCPWTPPHSCNNCDCLTCTNVCDEEDCDFDNCTWITPHNCGVCGCTVCPNVCGGANCNFNSCSAPKPTEKPSASPTPTATPAPTASPSPNPVIPTDLFENALNSGDTIKLTPETGTTISGDALNLIKNSGVPVQIELPNGLVITIDPASITDQAKMIDLNIEIFTTFQTTVVIDDVTVPALGIIINPAASGYFGFEISFNIPASMVLEMGLDPALVKLWYVSYEGFVTEKVGGVILNADGTLTVTIDGASFYVLAEKPPEGKDIRAPKTGDNSMYIQSNGVSPWIWLTVATMFVIGITLKLGRNKLFQLINKLK